MASHNDVERARRDGVLFGIPLGDLGWFASLLMGVATGMAAFFLTTFVAIVFCWCSSLRRTVFLTISSPIATPDSLSA